MDGPRITVATQYGHLEVGIGAGPQSLGSNAYANDGKYPSAAHVFGRDPEAPSLYAFVQSEDGQLTINGIPYTVAYARFTLREAQPGRGEVGIDWREEYGNGSPLKRSDVIFGGEPTDAARKAWREVIAPAIVAGLRTSSQQATEAGTLARRAFRADVIARADALRAEADRLVGLIAAEPPM